MKNFNSTSFLLGIIITLLILLFLNSTNIVDNTVNRYQFSFSPNGTIGIIDSKTGICKQFFTNGAQIINYETEEQYINKKK